MTKNIAIMDSVYEELISRKKPDESFSREIMRFIDKKKTIADLGGAWKITDKEADEMKKNIKELKQITTQKKFSEKYDRPGW